MEFEHFQHRHALTLLQSPKFYEQWKEISSVLYSITEEEIIKNFLARGDKRGKSLSKSINIIIKNKLIEKGWSDESFIFQNPNYKDDTWRLDFAKNDISIEVGFNHGSVIAWNLLKPVLASEINHVEKAIQTQIALVITATDELKRLGGFDNAIGSFEKYKSYLVPLNNQLTVPTLIIGLKALKNYSIYHEVDPITKKKLGFVKKH